MASSPAVAFSEEKDASTIDVVEIQSSSSNTDFSSAAQEEWQPGFRARFPWFGFATLSLAICITIASIIVLIVSNHKAVSQWPQKIAPNVILSIFNSAASICFALAVAQGIAIAWWRRALRGASIGDLHTTWSFGDSSLSLIKYVKKFNLAAVAALAAKLAIVDGVLFQRSTGTYVAIGPAYSTQLTTFPSTYLPYIASLNDYGNDTASLWYWFTVDVYQWQEIANGHVSYVYGFECEGVCTFNLTVPGYVATCTSEETSVDYYAAAEAQVMGQEDVTSNSTYNPQFATSFNLTLPTAAKNYTWIGVNTTSYEPLSLDPSNSTQRCPATLIKHTCELRQATINYPLYVQSTNTASKIRGQSSTTIDVGFGSANKTDGTFVGPGSFDIQTGLIQGFHFVDWIENATMTRPDKNNHTADGGIFRAMADRYTSTGTIEYRATTNASVSQVNSTNATNPEISWNMNNHGSLIGSMWYINGATNDKYNCPASMTDPMRELVLSVNTLAFTTAQDISNRPGFLDSWGYASTEPDDYWTFYDDNSVYTPVKQAKIESHYVTRYGWMFGALASTICCVILVLPAYWGFWELGRKVTLNPIEVANAFQAPVLAQGTTSARSGVVEDVVKAVKDRRVVYAEDAGESGRRHIIVPR